MTTSKLCITFLNYYKGARCKSLLYLIDNY
ncbi:hypothetical protein [Staphylococcus phage PT1-4]